ncbi:hypothetical protein T03_5843 [Trichinella britovi]|uniref:Uncharacterized protein n=1 Tax=Trichinella britovi TaxID=45882 RepID=A0A0V1C6J5_TRIBR|nr:hypothetical protein T03_5843 [Trichinella britovi]
MIFKLSIFHIFDNVQNSDSKTDLDYNETQCYFFLLCSTEISFTSNIPSYTDYHAKLSVLIYQHLNMNMRTFPLLVTIK